MFKEINEAYSTLGDDEKRKQYDYGGNSSNHSGGYSSSSRGRGFSDIFGDLFRNGSFGGGFSDDEEEEVDADLRYELTIEFTEAAFGCEKELLIKKDIFCDLCDGTGAEDKKLNNCDKCGGQGRVKINQRTPWGLMSQVIRCNNCNGTGKTALHKCSRCNGSRILNSKEKVSVKIPAGIDNGQTLRVRNAGNATENGEQGDLFLTIRVKPHKIFKREDFDIYMDLTISFAQAALGAEIAIPTLSGEEIKIKVANGTESGSILRLKDKGIAHLNNPNRHGNQFVKIVVKTPKKLSKAQTKLFEELAKLDE
jgi:molecular chaperone DnaJ